MNDLKKLKQYMHPSIEEVMLYFNAITIILFLKSITIKLIYEWLCSHLVHFW